MSRLDVPVRTVRLVARLLPALMVLAVCPGAASAERFGGTLLDGSQVRYDASAGWETWQGVAPPRLERLTFDDEDLSTLRLDVRVAADDFVSGNPFRDRNARRVVFETADHPEVTFELLRVRAASGTDDASGGDGDDGGDAAEGATAPAAVGALPDGAERSLTLIGTLELHGVERQVEVPVTVLRDGDRLAVTGGFTVLLSDYAMTAPSIFGRGVDEEVRIRFDLVVALAPG